MTNTERPQPYVGISGVANYLKHREPSGLEVGDAQQVFIEAAAINTGLFETGRQLALGVKAVHQSQWNDEPFVRGKTTYGTEWYPVGAEQFKDAALPYNKKHPQTLGVMQMYFNKRQVHDSGYRDVFLTRTAWRGRKWVEAVQFDSLPWQEDERLLRSLELTKKSLDLKTILQCHEKAMETLGPKGVVEMLGRHAVNLDYVLFDASHGMGKRLDVTALDPFLEEAYSSEALSKVGFAVAGGLNPDVVREELPSLLEKYDGLSVDAEEYLHPRNNMNKYPIQMDRAKDYLQAVTDVILASQKG